MKKVFLSKVSFLLTSLLFTFTLVLLLVNSVNVSAATITNDALPPSNLTYNLTTPDDIQLTWSSVYSATGYNVYGITDGQLTFIGKTTSASYTMSNLLEGSYSYVVSTLSVGGESGPCAPVSMDIVYPDMTAPATLTNTFKNGNDIVLNWSSFKYAEKYNVYQIDTDGQKTLVTSAIGLSYTITNAPVGTYSYAVSAVNSLYGESPISNSLQVNVVLPIMAAPSNLTSKIQNGNDVVLTWGSVSNSNSYKVYELVNGVEVLKTTVSSNTLTLANIQAGNHIYVVHSYSDRFGESAVGSQVSQTVDELTMQAPANLTFSLVNGNGSTLKWSAATYATAYNIYQIIDGQKVLKSTITGTTITYTNMPAGNYVYEVYSYSDRYGESPVGSQTTITLGDVTMAAPTNFDFNITNGNDITLTWDSMENATSYKIYLVSNGQKTLKSTITGTTITYANMATGDYSYEIQSYSTSLGESTEGSQLSVTLTFPVMEVPTNLVGSIKSATSFTLNWDASSYATSYKVYQIVNGTKVLKSTVSGTAVTYINMASGDYDFEVHSYSSRFGESVEGSNLTMTLDGQVMEAPIDLTYSTANINDITLKWTAVTYATSYKIYQVIDGQNVLKKTVTGTTATFANMQEGNYNYVVTSVSTLLGESPIGAEINFSLDLPTMVSPGDLAYKIQNGNNVVLTWTGATYANNYKVYELIDGQEVLKTTVTSLTATLSNVAAGDHTYFVHSVSTRFGESPEGNQISFNVQQNYMVAPTGLTYSIVNGNDIALKWTAATYATSYNIYQVIDGQNVFKKTVTGTTVSFTNMPAGDYDYVVTSVSTVFGASLEGSQISLTLEQQYMEVPINLTNTITNGNYITLKWDAVTYATAYNIYQIINGQKSLVKTVTSASATFANMPEGDFSYEVYSYSTRFGESETGSSIDLTLTWPVVQTPVLTDSIYNVNNITLSWQAITWANEYRIYEVIDGTRKLLYAGTALSYKLFNVSEDTHNYEMTAHSIRFGESVYSNTITETIVYPEMLSPVASIKLIDKNSALIYWSFVPYSNGYNVYEIIDGNIVLIIENLNNLSYNLTNLSYKDHQYYVTSVSNSFGESQQSNTVIAILIVDTEAPKTVSDAPTDWINKSPLVVNLSATDNETGVAHTYYSINDGDFTEGTSFTLDKEGINKISYYSVDKVGNKEVVQISYVKIDKTAPVTTSNVPGTWVKEDVTINLASTDAQSGVFKTFYSIDGSDYLEGTFFTIKDEGIHKITFYSVDAAGNIESVKTAEVKIDKTAPVTTSNVLETWAKEDVTVNLASTDTQSGVTKTFYSIDGSDYLEGTSFTIKDEGIHKITFYSVDAAGNVESVKTAEVKIEKTDTVIIMDLLKEYKICTTLPLIYTVKDNSSSIVDEKMIVFGPNETIGRIITNNSSIKFDKPGTYKIVVTVTDASGITTTIEREFVVYIPAKVIIKCNKGRSTVHVKTPCGHNNRGCHGYTPCKHNNQGCHSYTPCGHNNRSYHSYTSCGHNTPSFHSYNAHTSNKGYCNQAKLGQFKFKCSDFNCI